jgi:hypothetical protein
MSASAELSLHTRPIERLPADVAVAGFFADDRPLRGGAGRLDWRLCGLLSRYLQEPRFSGVLDERVLMPGADRIAPNRLFLFGLGARKRYSDTMKKVVEWAPEVLKSAGCRHLALALPGPSRVIAGHVEALSAELGERLEVIFDADGRLREWMEKDKG